MDEPQYYRISAAELDRLDIPYQGREWQVEAKGEKVMVTFLPPENSRAGKFVVVVDKASGEVLDSQIWR